MPRAHKNLLTLAPFMALLALACGGPQRPSLDVPLRPLGESQALEVMTAALRDRGVPIERNRRIELSSGGSIEADFVMGGTTHAIEYLQDSDRAHLTEQLPAQRNPDVMLTCRGGGADAAWDVLLLDARDYQYTTDASSVGPGRPSLIEVEDRLRRTMFDYIAHTRRPR